MAISVNTTYPPGRYVDPSAEYPTGSIKDSSLPTLKDGSPLLAAQPNDMQGFTDALLAAAGIAHSGTPDTALSSQRLEALLKVILSYSGLTPVFGGGSLEANKRYLITDNNTYTLPETTSLGNEDSVEVVRFGSALFADPTPSVSVDGTNSEEIEYYNENGVLNQTDTSVTYNTTAGLTFIFNETSGNWEL